MEKHLQNLAKCHQGLRRIGIYWVIHLVSTQDFPKNWHSFITYAKLSGRITFLNPVIRTRTHAYQGVRNVTFPEFCGPTEWIIPIWESKIYQSFSITFLGVKFSRSKISFLFAILGSTNQFTNYLLVYFVKLISCEFSSDRSLQKHIALKSEKKFPLKTEDGAVLSLCWRHMLNFKSRAKPLRNSRSQMFFIMGALKNFSNLTGKRLC